MHHAVKTKAALCQSSLNSPIPRINRIPTRCISQTNQSTYKERRYHHFIPSCGDLWSEEVGVPVEAQQDGCQHKGPFPQLPILPSGLIGLLLSPQSRGNDQPRE